ncbi:neural/ectodermal development factor IMP-L2-like [Planococcus citri]|uniref:neural/ectodermal development factor IMP-L2-like n=1 Tax=Planococcus citri TaxID=170843 RepID=UPI0031F9E270
MEAIRGLFVLLVAVTAIDASVVTNLYKLTKVPGRTPNRRVPLQGEWINISMRSDPVLTVPTGTAVELECEAVGSPPPSIKWHHGSNQVTEAEIIEQNEVVNTAIGKVRSRLVIDCATSHHQGMYSCSGTSGAKSKNSSPTSILIEADSVASTECQPNAQKSPRITVWGPTMLEVIDKDVTLQCSAVGNPKPEIYWLNNKNQVLDTDLVSPHYKVLSNGDLIINQITWDDMGTYTCIAQNSLGQDKIESFIYPVKKESSTQS